MKPRMHPAALFAASLLTTSLFAAVASAQCETDAMTGSESVLGWPFFGTQTLVDSVLSLDGDTLAVGCVNDYVYVFSRSGATWTEEVVLYMTGWSVAVEGDTLAIGSLNVDALVGSAEVWVRSGSTWSLQQSLSDGVSGTGFGSAVALSGDTLVVGARNAASAHVFVRSGGTWSPQQVLTPSGSGAFFGDDVDIDGDRIVVGASNAGRAYVFERSGTAWTETAMLTPDVPLGNRFGYDVDLDGSTLAVAAEHSLFAGNPGSAYVFVESAGVWSQQAEFPVDKAVSVALQGDVCLVGAEQDIGGGSVSFFQRSGTTWTQTKKLYGSTGTGNFGNSVVLDGATAAALAPSWNSQDQLFFIDMDPSHCPGVAFEGAPLSGVEPLTVDFTDLSTGSVTSWSWDFGDGATSDLQHPSHDYNTGTYLVSLLVEGPGGRERDVKEDYIDALLAASATIRNGSGVNGLYLTSLNLPVMGTPWDLEIDHAHHGPALSLLRGHVAPLAGSLTGFGELLINVGSLRLYSEGRLSPDSPDLYSLPVPVDIAFVGAQGYFQGAIFSSFVELTNAIDAVVGF